MTQESSTDSGLFRSIDSGIRRDDPAAQADPGEFVTLRLNVLSAHVVFSEGNEPLRGIFLATPLPRPLKSHVTMEIELPWGEKVVLEGRVAWVRKQPKLSLRDRAGMGVAFDPLTAERRALLNRALLLHETIEIPPDAERAS